jgi:hypothetical protein
MRSHGPSLGKRDSIPSVPRICSQLQSRWLHAIRPVFHPNRRKFRWAGRCGTRGLGNPKGTATCCRSAAISFSRLGGAKPRNGYMVACCGRVRGLRRPAKCARKRRPQQPVINGRQHGRNGSYVSTGRAGARAAHHPVLGRARVPSRCQSRRGSRDTARERRLGAESDLGLFLPCRSAALGSDAER